MAGSLAPAGAGAGGGCGRNQKGQGRRSVRAAAAGPPRPARHVPGPGRPQPPRPPAAPHGEEGPGGGTARGPGGGRSREGRRAGRGFGAGALEKPGAPRPASRCSRGPLRASTGRRRLREPEFPLFRRSRLWAALSLAPAGSVLLRRARPEPRYPAGGGEGGSARRARSCSVPCLGRRLGEVAAFPAGRLALTGE